MNYIDVFIDVSLMIFTGFIATYLFEKRGIPESVILVLAGILIGPVFGIISPRTFESLLSILSNVALLVVLFESGLSLNLFEVLKNVWKAIALSATYFISSSILISFSAYRLLELPLMESLLLGTILGGVSSVATIPLIERLASSEDVRTIISLDSTFSDVFVIIISLALLQFISTGGSLALSDTLHNIISSFSIGLVFGIVGGVIWIKVLRSLKHMKYSYMLTIAFLLLLYSLTDIVRGSGAIACLVVGLMLSNARVLAEMLRMERPFKLKHVMVYFHEEISFFIRTFFYISLGALFTVQCISYNFIMSSLMIVLCMIVSRYLSLLPIIRDSRERTRLSFIIPRGLSAAVLASYILQYDIPSKYLLSSFITTGIVLSNLISVMSALIRGHEEKGYVKALPVEQLTRAARGKG
ncbi:MAG: hypothetical protein DRZ82_06845 [Thermoprotei archaeon]|nr:MAG: hypothetical protein DRZ82_06845 [Thermoprotei archaeon]